MSGIFEGDLSPNIPAKIRQIYPLYAVVASRAGEAKVGWLRAKNLRGIHKSNEQEKKI
jgi:hypothetical protein